MNRFIDLRSDTVTRPTAAMRQAMFEAEVGDDVYHEDPTVNRLEARAAEIMGKEAGLFVPSGTMGNQIAIMTHTRPGQEVICEERSHTVLYEMGGTARLSLCLARTIPTEAGILTWATISKRVRGPSDHFHGTGLIILENTHNMAGGRVTPLATIREICDNAHDRGLKVHMDGARIFNAAIHLGVTVAELAAPLDSVMFCLSKGLGAPVGSMLVGRCDFIEQARLARKALGGGMRQAGILAAAGLVALEKSPAGMSADHAKARFIAESLAEIPGIGLDPAQIETNIIRYDISDTGLTSEEFSRRLKERGVLANGAYGQMRMVTHFDVSHQDCEQAMEAVREAVAPVPVSSRA